MKVKGKKKKVQTNFDSWFKQFQEEMPVEVYFDIRFVAEAAFLAGQIAAEVAFVKMMREINTK